MAVLTIGSFIWVAIMVGDLPSLLIVFGFAFLLLGAMVAVVGLFWLVVPLIRRRGRIAAAAFVWSAASLAVFGLVGIAILAPRPPSVPDSMATAAELDQFLEDLVSSGSPPGISLVVVKDGETVYNKAFGVADGPNGTPATPDTVYHWFSTTKIVTAIAIMQLVERGLIDLDDPVSDHLPFFDPEYPSVSSEPVTVVNLLNHSSGLRDNIPEVVGWVRREDEEAMRANEGAGMHPMADILTGFIPIISPPWPSDYIREYDDGRIWFNRFLFDGNAPSGLIGPAPEMARLVAAILNGGEFEGARILSQESVETMLNERHVEPGSSGQWSSYTRRFAEFVQGIGWRVVRDGGRLHHSHGGSGAAFAAFMRIYPEENLGIVILVNGTNVESLDIADAVADIQW